MSRAKNWDSIQKQLIRLIKQLNQQSTMGPALSGEKRGTYKHSNYNGNSSLKGKPENRSAFFIDHTCGKPVCGHPGINYYIDETMVDNYVSINFSFNSLCQYEQESSPE